MDVPRRLSEASMLERSDAVLEAAMSSDASLRLQSKSSPFLSLLERSSSEVCGWARTRSSGLRVDANSGGGAVLAASPPWWPERLREEKVEEKRFGR
jgi:hypothetical protein